MSIDHDILYGPCPCGSGLKFKFCCFRSVRDGLPPNPTQAEVATAVRRFRQPFGMVNDVDPHEDREAIDLTFQGIAKRNKGDFIGAVKLFRRARDERPKIYTAWNNEATCLWHCGRFEEAVDAQERGLEHSADINAFGWAQLSEMRYFLGDDKGAAEAADKGAVLTPMSEDGATKVCAALGHLRRHGQLLSYARGSGFDRTPWVAFYAGVAALNLGDREAACPLLETAVAGLGDSWIVRETHRKAGGGGGAPRSPSGEWPYFGTENYGAGRFEDRALEHRDPPQRNVVCDLAEIMLMEGEMDKAGALELLKPYRGGRAALLREGLAKTHDFDGPLDDDGDDADGDDDEAAWMEDFSRDNPDFDFRKLSLSVVPGGTLDDPEDEALFEQAGADFNAGKPGGKLWERARRGFKKVLKRNPGFFRAEYNLAAMLEREGKQEEADAILRRIAADHPDYVFARAALLRNLLNAGDLEGAGKLVETYRPPKEMNPIEFRAWLRVVKLYYDAVGEDIRAGNTADAIREIERAFNL